MTETDDTGVHPMVLSLARVLHKVSPYENPGVTSSLIQAHEIIAALRKDGMAIMSIEPSEKAVQCGLFGKYMAEWEGINDSITFSEYCEGLERREVRHLAEDEIRQILKHAMSDT